MEDHEREELRTGRFDAFLGAAEAHALPACVLAPDRASELAPVAERFPELRIVLCHLGLDFMPPPPADDDKGLASLLSLVGYPNVAVNVSRAVARSVEPYPFLDLWPMLHRIVSGFGPERLMWGSDWTTVSNVTYPEGVAYCRETDQLDHSAKEQLMGGTLRRIFGWDR
jgi:predicted TIM-barrel fold metal-dependent hydrolase